MRALLFSGGLDSTALAYWLRPDVLIFCDYGQIPAKGELRAANQISLELDIPIELIECDCRSLGAGSMAGKSPTHKAAPESWPFRNQLLMTVAAMKLANSPAIEIIVGTVSSDRVHADGSRRFIRSMSELLELQGSFSLIAPAIDMSAFDLQRIANVPVELLSWCFSCHVSDHACGQCRGCIKHQETMQFVAQERESNRHEVNS